MSTRKSLTILAVIGGVFSFLLVVASIWIDAKIVADRVLTTSLVIGFPSLVLGLMLWAHDPAHND